MYIITLPKVLPMFYLPPVIEGVMMWLSYQIYLAFWYTTGETVLVTPQVIFACIVGTALAVFAASLAKDS